MIYSVVLVLLLLLIAPAADAGKGETFYPDKAVLDDFPREAPLNGMITFRTLLKRGYRAPVFVLTRPDGETGYLHPIRTEPGGSSSEHSHPDMVLYAVTDCAWDLTAPDGETVTAEIPAGATIYLDATTHSAKDVGSSGSLAIAIELK